MGLLKFIIQNFFADLISPSQKNCLICGSSCHNQVCKPCQSSIVQPHMSRCPICGRYTLEKIRHSNLCIECQEEVPPFYLARSIGPYGGALKDALYAFKYQRKRLLASYLGELMGGVFLKESAFWETELLVPVPLSSNKEAKRGFNQSQLLADELGKFLRIKVEKTLIRTKDTTRQSQLSRHERIQNMKGIFALAQSVKERHILLVDDVFTTGATAAECTRVLLQGGAIKVGIITAASGLRQKNNLNNAKDME